MRILRIAEAVYEEVRPYFGFLDSEIVGDESSDLLAKGVLPIANSFVILGPALLQRFGFEELRAGGHSWKDLPDGGVLVQNRRAAGGATGTGVDFLKLGTNKKDSNTS